MRTAASALLAVTIAAAPAAGQSDDGGPRRHDPSAWFAGASFTYAQPQGAFRDAVDRGLGGTFHGVRRVAGELGLRATAGLLNYGHERERLPLTPITGRVSVDVTTSNNIAFLGVGPQVGVPDGTLKPYAHGYAGVSYLWTESSLASTRSDESFATSTNYEDATFSWGGGGGLYVPVRRGATSVSIDLGVLYHNNGRARYLGEGDIVDNPDRTISFTPRETDTDLLSFHVGVSVAIPRK